MSIDNAAVVSRNNDIEDQHIREVLEVEQELDKYLLIFAKKFVNAPPDERKTLLEFAENAWASSHDEYERLILEFISDLCKKADERDGERRSA